MSASIANGDTVVNERTRMREEYEQREREIEKDLYAHWHAPVSWTLATFLSTIPFPRTHLLGVLIKR